MHTQSGNGCTQAEHDLVQIEDDSEERRDPQLAVGTVCRFNYPEHFYTLPEYSLMRGARVTITRHLRERAGPDGPAEYENLGDPMYEFQTSSGWKGCAWESELEVVR